MSDEEQQGGGALPVYGRLREPNHRVRHDGWTGERQRAFLDALARAGNVRDACRTVGLSNASAYRLRRVDPAFGEAWDQALKRAATSLEAVAFARAVDGTEEVVIRKGEEVSRRRKPSDSLLRMLLQASDPEKYGRTGPNASVKAREEVEARVREIEEAAYNRAWRAMLAEYRYILEPEYMTIWTLTRLSKMHLRICENPWCRFCHPERAEEESLHPAGYEPGPDHDPIDPPSRWWKEVSDGHAADVLDARLAGQEPWIDDRIPPYPSYPDMQKANPPRYRPAPPPALPPAPPLEGEG